MRNIASVGMLCAVLAGCGPTLPDTPVKATESVRGVDSGTRQVVDHYYSVEPDCSNPGYPEIKVIRGPAHGTVEVEHGETYPGFNKDNVRYECNKSKVASSQVSYQSVAGYHGKDSFEIQVRFVNSTLRLINYTLDVI